MRMSLHYTTLLIVLVGVALGGGLMFLTGWLAPGETVCIAVGLASGWFLRSVYEMRDDE